MTEQSKKYTLAILNKYKNILSDILHKENLQQHLKNIEKDIAFIDAQPDKENYDVIKKNLSFFKWVIAEKS